MHRHGRGAKDLATPAALTAWQVALALTLTLTLALALTLTLTLPLTWMGIGKLKHATPRMNSSSLQ